MTQSFNVGDRVRFCGSYVLNRTFANPEQDLVPGYLGTIVAVDTPSNPYPHRVRFDDHTGVEPWWVADNEIEPVVEVIAPEPGPTIIDVSKYIVDRVAELEGLIKHHPKGTEQYYSLIIGQFELLRLAVSLGLPNVVDETTVVNPVPTA